MKASVKAAEEKAPTIRLDRWLCFARFCKTRAVAQKLITRGQVILNGSKVGKVGAPVRSGDRLAVTLGPVKRTVTVREVGERRGPAAEARLLYDESTPPEKLTSEYAGLPIYRRPLLVREKGAGRPTKKDRRAIDKHQDGGWDDDSDDS
jgi:ribosome-associated heat shock protein Hsp15